MRIGFVGGGNIARAHMEAFEALRNEGSELELAAVADTHEPSAEECAQEFGIGMIHADASGLIADRSIDALVIAVPNCYHAALAVAALDAGKDLLLEKPMAADLAGARDIYSKQQETGRVVMLCHQMRWTWWALAMKQRLDDGALGQVYHAKTGWMRREGIPGWGTWFTEKKISGGGPLIDIGVHMLDLTLYLLGNPIPTAVSGVTAAMFGPEKRGIGDWGAPDWNGPFDVEDFASAMVRLADGNTLNLDVSWAAHVDRPAEYIDLLGSAGGLSYYGGGLKFLTGRDGELVDEAIELPGTNERLEMTREFLNSVESGMQPSCDAFSGLVNNAVLDAIYRSAESGAEVAVDLPGPASI